MKNKINKQNPEYVIAPLAVAAAIIKSAYPNMQHSRTLPEDDKRSNEKVAIALNFPKIKK